MKNYKIYTDQTGHTKTVKIGWSWSAFCFTWIWALKKKIWGMTTLSTVFLMLSCAFSLVLLAITPELATKLSLNFLFIYSGYLILGFCLLMGLNGNQWYENKLLKNGARFQTIIAAENATDAMISYEEKSIDKYVMVA
ncbi:MAG: DUF2628 domain-containing protein [Cocleimonas sp.]|nr:DUF2628 domain-containing protein [Cocleimonas sp.]